MNGADAFNAATYALRRIEIIAQGGMLGMTDWGEEDEEARLNEIEHEVDKVTEELRSAGYDVDHNL